MNDQKLILNLFIRKPLLPAIIISKDELIPFTDMDTLAVGLMKAEPEDRHVRVVDSAGDEFWFIPEQRALAPGFTSRKWTKMRLIDLVNGSSNTKRLGVRCSIKGLSNRRFAGVMELMIAVLVSPAGRNDGDRR